MWFQYSTQHQQAYDNSSITVRYFRHTFPMITWEILKKFKVSICKKKSLPEAQQITFGKVCFFYRRFSSLSGTYIISKICEWRRNKKCEHKKKSFIPSKINRDNIFSEKTTRWAKILRLQMWLVFDEDYFDDSEIWFLIIRFKIGSKTLSDIWQTSEPSKETSMNLIIKRRKWKKKLWKKKRLQKNIV